MKIRTLIIGLYSAILFSACAETKEKKTITTPTISFEKEGEVFLTNPEGDTITRFDVEIADNEYERETGLMYRDKLEEDQGMIFIFEDEAPRGFYMKNTTIPLDILFLDKDLKIVSVVPETKPESLETIPSGVPAKYVLEINAGLAQKWSLKEGDYVHLTKYEE